MDNTITIKKVILAVIGGILSLFISQMIMQSIVTIIPIPNEIASIISGTGYILLTYFLLRLLCNKVLKISLESCHIGKVNLKAAWIITAFILPIAVSVILLLMPGEMIHNEVEGRKMSALIANAVFCSGLGAGIVEEFVFRGVIMHVLDMKWGKKTAIIVPSLIFGLLHIIGADLDLLSILFLIIAGTSVGIMFSLVVYESGSIWNSAIIHVMWNIIIIGRILNIGDKVNKNAIYSYKLVLQSFFITGGDFGIESSAIAVAGYIIVCVIAYALIKRKSKTN